MRAKVLAGMVFAALTLGGQAARAQYVDQFAERYHLLLMRALQVNGQVTALGLNMLSAAMMQAEAEDVASIGKLFEQEGEQAGGVFNSQSMLLVYIMGAYGKKPTITTATAKVEMIKAMELADLRLSLCESHIKTLKALMGKPVIREDAAVPKIAQLRKEILSLKEAAKKL